jgi:3-ketosteroid 9alpha-monooxygenase subunit A
MLLHGLDLDLTGWFQVSWSGDIGQEQVVPLRYFGRDLVAYRGRDGVVRVHDRHCRHLGASLAHGGCVVDGGIQCPFHGWVWAPDGHNISIPYQDRPNRARRLGTWPTVERNESVYVWFDHSGRDPLWDVPDALHGTPQAAEREFHPAWPDGRQHYRDLRIHPQMVVENAVDPDDIGIWDNQIFLDPPVLATEEGSGLRRIRRWARQFYPGDGIGNAPAWRMPSGVTPVRSE